MDEPLTQVYVPSVATAGGERTELGVFRQEEDAWDVLRAFLAKAAATKLVSGRIRICELDFVGEEGQIDLAVFDRQSCPVCDELTFWVEGDQSRAQCHYPRCGAWIEKNTYDHLRWDCGWPAAAWNKRADDYKSAYRGLVEMRAQSNAAGTETTMPSREDWLAGREEERKGIRKRNVDAVLDELLD